MPEDKKKRLEWSPVARRDLFAAWEFIARDNLAAADRLSASLFRAADLIAEQPFVGKPGGVKNTRELVVADAHFLVVYRIVRDAVRIGRVLHTSRRYPR